MGVGFVGFVGWGFRGAGIRVEGGGLEGVRGGRVLVTAVGYGELEGRGRLNEISEGSIDRADKICWREITLDCVQLCSGLMRLLVDRYERQ